MSNTIRSLNLNQEQLLTILFVFCLLVIPKAYNIYFAKNKETSHSITKRLPFFDGIKGIAILAVIFIHTMLVHDYFHPHEQTIFINIANNIARFAVPLFLIISGILLNPHDVTNKKYLSRFYLRRVTRVIIPYVFISILIAVYTNARLDAFVYHLVTGRTLVPYYFIIILVQLYLLYPIPVHFRRSRYFLEISFIISLISSLIPSLSYIFDIPLFLKYLFFFCYGIANREKFLKDGPEKQTVWFWASIIGIYIIFSLWSQEYFYNIQFFYGLAIFNILVYLKASLMRLPFISFVTALGRNTLWIYLIHFQILMVLYQITKGFALNYYAYLFLIFSLASMCSFLLAYCIKVVYQRIFKS